MFNQYAAIATKKAALSTISALLLCTGTATAHTHYASVYNGFAAIGKASSIQPFIDKNCLVLTNSETTPVCIIDSASITDSSYKYYARIANQNNDPNKAYAVSCNGKQAKVKNPSWGIFFNQTDSSRWVVELCCPGSGFHDDIASKRTMTVKLIYQNGNSSTTVRDTVVEKGINLHTGFNVVSAEVNGDKVSIKAGDKKLQELFSLTDTRLHTNSAVASGLLIGSGASVRLERSVIQTSSTAAINLNTPWTKELLDDYFAHSTDIMEGYWTYLDRDMEDKWLRIGGRYTIALVKRKDGYDAIYIDGAKVKKSQWKTGMLKATMNNTIFTDNYTGTWFDATQKPISEDVYVTVENGTILNFKFPVYKSQLRFSKLLPIAP